MDDQSLRLKMFLERLGNTFLMCDERGIRNCIYAPTMSRSGVRFPSGLLYGDSDDSDDSDDVDDDESEVVSENDVEGIAESEDSQANTIDGVGHDDRAEEGEAEEIMWSESEDESENEVEGIAESEDSQANTIDGVGHDDRAEEAEAVEVMWSESDDWENGLEGILEGEDSQANTIDGAGHDDRAEEAEAEKIVCCESDNDCENEAAGPQLGAENSDETEERSGAGGDKNGEEQGFLSVQFDNCSPSAMNPFEEYGQYDGTSQPGAGTSTFRVFLSMLPPSEQNPPLRVCVLKSATFSDLIGLAFFKYAFENPNWSVRLKDDVSEYGMCIAGEEGELGSEPYVLDSEEMIGDFPHVNLAVIESSGKEMELLEPEEEDALIYAGDRGEFSE